MSKKSISISNIYSSISLVSRDAVLNQLQLRNKGLRQYLKKLFSNDEADNECFLADPVIEATFGYRPATDVSSMTELAKNGELTSELVQIMDEAFAPDTEKQRKEDKDNKKVRLGYSNDIDDDYTWPKERPPYLHQHKSWKILGSDTPKSTVITSGTGSGKTECFLVPLLDNLARQVIESDETLVGVQAIMLYPLNALINSQEERLSALLRGFEGKIRYAKYTGETDEEAPPKAVTALKQSTPEKVQYRKEIRETPPPILVTNSTILEYMLVRPIDRDILSKSKGKLKWIILDEAHTLVGTQAAEISLLLRRTMLAFDVNPEDIRFVATSATIGDSKDWVKTEKKLKEFLAGLAGIHPDKVNVVNGERLIPSLPDMTVNTEHSIKQLEKMASAEAYDALCNMPMMRNLRQKLSDYPLTITEIAEQVYLGENDITSKHKGYVTRFVDVATNAFPGGNSSKEAFFPVRVHLFHRAQRGLWACIDPACKHKHGTALDDDWPFGKVFVEERTYCLEGCSSPVYELTHCKECKEPSLAASIASDADANRIILQREHDDLDEYFDDIEVFDNDEQEQVDIKKLDNIQLFSSQSKDLQRYALSGGAVTGYIEPKTRKIKNKSEDGLEIRYTLAHRDSALRCACCDTTEQFEGQTFRRALLGAPFLMANIVPEMLRHVPRKNVDSLIGSRLITFTDSRQGTARFSAKLQLDSERKWCRSTIYRELARNSGVVDFKNHPDLKGLFEVLALYTDEEQQRPIKELIEKKKIEIAGDRFQLKWTDVAEILARSPEIQILSGEIESEDKDLLSGEYQERDERLSKSKDLAHLFLLREFCRRPKNANNLETLGLVTLVYPALDKITEEDLNVGCKSWLSLKLNLDDWKNYLKIILDFYIRENTLVDVHSYQVNWMGGKIFARLLQEPSFNAETEDEKKAIWAFPSVNKGNQHKLVRMIELWSTHDAKNEPEKFNTILEFAWKTLKKLQILEFYQDEYRDWRKGYHLKFENAVSFELTLNASICPITNRWLDTTFKGITPYINSKTELADANVNKQSFNIPHPEPTMLKGENSTALRTWLIENEFITSKKEIGVWRDVTDAAILPPAMLRSAEHSAQQKSSKLKGFEKAFKKDFLNVLNCSTTMEMGVDIGALTMVAMNNAPPSTANYLQRAGRAGRRGETTSVVLTFCKANPHGERIFSHPKWPFDTPIPVPRVALESIPIVSRHLNAYLLASYLNNMLSNESLPKLKAGKFFISDTNVAVFERFINWLEQGALNDKNIQDHLAILIQGSGLSGHAISSLLSRTTASLVSASDHWLTRFNAIEYEIKNAIQSNDNEDSSPAKRRLDKQKKDMESEPLLNVLAKRGFLPGYGFPINVVELVTNNKMEKKSFLRSNYPSRSLETAIREYAPGSDIVLNGSVYRSMGLQLSWNIPQSPIELKKLQQLRYVTHCEDCGFSETDSLGISAPKLDVCPDCESKNIKLMEYIIPGGFKVDYKSSLHNDYTQPTYAPYIEPFLSIIDADWQVLNQIELGRFKVSDAGQLFYYNDGNGAGYVLCWSCGKMEALKATTTNGKTYINSDKPAALITNQSHDRLSGVSFDGQSKCERNDWSIKVSSSKDEDNRVLTPFVLGFDSSTSMFELQLRHPETHEWIDDDVVMYSLGAALRQVFCKEKGISTNEIGLSVYRRRINVNSQQKASSVFLYDTAEQGAGYSSSIHEILPQLLKDVFEYAKSCPSACDAYCHGCLLDYDTQHHITTLDRKALIYFFEETQLHKRLEVEKSRLFFGEGSLPELSCAQQLVSLKGRSSTRIDLFVSGTDWDIAKARVINHIYNLHSSDIRILVSKSAASSITPDLAWKIRTSLPANVDLFTYEHPTGLSTNAVPILRMKFTDGNYWYATDDIGTTSLNSDWGSTINQSLVSMKGGGLDLQLQKLDIAALAMTSPLESNLALIDDIGSRLDVSFNEFGQALYALLIEKSTNLETELSVGIEKVVYSDRYLVSPISVSLICSFFAEIFNKHQCSHFEIETSYPENYHGKSPYCIADNFNDINDISDFLSGVGESYGIDIYPDYIDKYELDHGRYLNIELKTGKTIQLLFDQGMGYWATRRPYGRIKFDFNNVKKEGSDLINKSFDIKSTDGGSYIVVHEI
jgi:DEAD/DEAH box helicase domain-containing protein